MPFIFVFDSAPRNCGATIKLVRMEGSTGGSHFLPEVNAGNAPVDVTQFVPVKNEDLEQLAPEPIKDTNLKRPLIVAICTLQTWATFVSREFYELLTNLRDYCGWKLMEPSQFEAALALRPRAILIWELPQLLQQYKSQWASFKGKKMYYAEDLHWFDDATRLKKSAGYQSCDLLITPNRSRLLEYYPEICCSKVVECPHAALPIFLKPVNPLPVRRLLLSGYIHIVYPMRYAVIYTAQKHKLPIDYVRHPGYQPVLDDTKAPVGCGYAVRLHYYLGCFACGSAHRYVTAKHYEIAATGALLITHVNLKKQLEELGFIEGKHYIATDESRVKETTEWVLNPANRREVDAIRYAGQQLVATRHMIHHRVLALGQHVLDFVMRTAPIDWMESSEEENNSQVSKESGETSS